MPTYEYICAEGHAFDRFQSINDRPISKCPECGARAERKISGGQGLIFKGSGFYITDYGKDGKGARKDPGGQSAGASDATAKPAAESSKPASDTSPAKPATKPSPSKGTGDAA